MDYIVSDLTGETVAEVEIVDHDEKSNRYKARILKNDFLKICCLTLMNLMH
jgi:hypothetical protein